MNTPGPRPGTSKHSAEFPRLDQLPPEHLRETTANHYAYHNYVTMDGRLTSQGIAVAAFGINVLAEACYVNARAHGWWPKTGRNFGEIIALIHSEASEALEAYRDSDNPQEISYEWPKNEWTGQSSENDPEFGGVPKPVGVASEMADIIIRVLDYCAALKVPIADAIIQKHAYNFERGHKHGGKLI